MDVLFSLKFNFSEGEIESNNVNVIEVVKNKKSYCSKEVISPFMMYSSELHIFKIESAALKNGSIDINDNDTVDPKFNYLTLISDTTDSSKKHSIDISHVVNNDLREKLMTIIYFLLFYENKCIYNSSNSSYLPPCMWMLGLSSNIVHPL